MVCGRFFCSSERLRSHTGGAMSYGTGIPISIFRKQKLSTKSSTEAELVGVDDLSTLILWTKMFLEAQGLYNSPIVMHQAKKVISYWSGMASGLQENVQEQSKSDFFFITDQVDKGNIEIEYCPTKLMIVT
jgi:hypothetical protein